MNRVGMARGRREEEQQRWHIGVEGRTLEWKLVPRWGKGSLGLSPYRKPISVLFG
jgi:hypothetical protein